jgi:hypothetical protein
MLGPDFSAIPGEGIFRSGTGNFPIAVLFPKKEAETSKENSS